MDFVHADLKTKCVKDYLLRMLFCFFFHSVKQETGNNNNDDDDDNNNKYEFLQETERTR